jgi:hypothetical protein
MRRHHRRHRVDATLVERAVIAQPACSPRPSTSWQIATRSPRPHEELLAELRTNSTYWVANPEEVDTTPLIHPKAMTDFTSFTSF